MPFIQHNNGVYVAAGVRFFTCRLGSREKNIFMEMRP